MEDKLSPYLCGFRNDFSTQYCMIIMLERWRHVLDKRNIAGALLTDLPKAFDSLKHDLLIAKLSADGFNQNSCTLILSYLFERQQRTKVSNSFSERVPEFTSPTGMTFY